MLSPNVQNVEIKAWIKKSVDENIWRITTDRVLQCFMAGAFSLLLVILIFCSVEGSFETADTCYGLLESLFSGHDVSALPNILFLIPPYLFSPDLNTFRYLFSLYGFAFYMLGGHFMLKSCRLTGYSEKDAYILLFVMFLCSLYSMLQSTGPYAAALVILSLWFFQRRAYAVSFALLGLATAGGLYPALLLPIYLVLGRADLRDMVPGIGVYLIVGLTFALIPKIGMCQTDIFIIGRSTAYLSDLNLDLDIIPSILIGSVIGVVALVFVFLKTRLHDNTIQDAACLLWTILIPILLLSTAHADSFFIWIAMLFPMTQMCEGKSMYRPPAYGMFVLFCVFSGICIFISASSELYGTAMFSRAMSLTALWILTIFTYTAMIS